MCFLGVCVCMWVCVCVCVSKTFEPIILPLGIAMLSLLSGFASDHSELLHGIGAQDNANPMKGSDHSDQHTSEDCHAEALGRAWQKLRPEIVLV